MSSAQDPFYVVREEIHQSIEKLLFTLQKWERLSPDSRDIVYLKKELLTSCESIEWQVDEVDKTIVVASRNPIRYGIDEVELERRKTWTTTARNRVSNVKKVVTGEIVSNGKRLPDSYQTQRTEYNDDFIQSESDKQLLLIKQQDEELDELSTSIGRIGEFGITIREELYAHERIVDELGMEMDNTSNRLDFVQKKLGIVMKKAGAKGQFMMILFLVALFIILFVLVFFT